jgi:plastocyanin
MRRAVIVFSAAGVCAIAATLFLWSVAPRSPADGLALDTHNDGGAASSTITFADTHPPVPPATDAAPDRPHADAIASGTAATETPKVEVAVAPAAPAPAPMPAAPPDLVPAIAAPPAKTVPAPDSSGDVIVGQKNREFTVKAAHVKVGGTVKFVNDDTVAHNVIVTMPGGELRNTGVQEPGQSASMQFSEAGKYDVECAIHPQMKMTVDVQ